MNFTRRAFLGLGGGATLAVLTGCDAWNQLPGVTPPLVTADPVRAPGGAEADAITHLLGRTSFGARPGDYARVAALGATPEEAAARYLEEQLAPDAIDDRPALAGVRRFDLFDQPLAEFYEYKEQYLLQQTIGATLLRAIYSRRQLYEVMVHFWTDHFNIDSSKGECKWLKTADDRDVIRRHALGTFPELLRASAMSPAMLWYLDGRVNMKKAADDKPNENYARELLELHTLGVHAGYTQHDVMEVARCLTGWSVRDRNQLRKGVVEFEIERHDEGSKTVLGQTIDAGGGAGDLSRVLEIVALHPATAKHVAEKLCRRFIADVPPPAAVEAVAAGFLASKGDIKTTLRVLFTRPEFTAARGAKLRRPLEFMVAAMRACEAEVKEYRPLVDYLVSMGHAPFQYPTPDGYAIQSAPWLGTLLWRWNFAVALAANRIPGVQIDAAKLRERCGGDEGLMSVLLGRRGTEEERSAYHESGQGLALLLASPSFQYC